MNSLLIDHKVADFPRWKAAYDDDARARREAGLTEKHLLQSVSDFKEIALLFEVADLEEARSFSESADLCDPMRDAGLEGTPVVLFLHWRVRAVPPMHSMSGNGPGFA